MQAEHDKTKLLVRAVRGGRFKGRKPNGDWFAASDGEVVKPTPVDLVLAVAALKCFTCGHEIEEHSVRELSEEEQKGKRNKDKKRCDGGSAAEPCSCVKTPDEIRAKQTDREWIAQRLASVMRERDLPGADRVCAATVFDGLRGPAVETEGSHA
ncbi:hypothetical protein D7X74_37835 [Corallococcus sp. CA047B]|nr:hypothetical protein D7X74_37835 [Corallococcus sp. CA047B]